MPHMDFKKAARFIAAVPKGRWTTYGDVATVAGNPRAAQAVGEWLRRSRGGIPCFWRVLRVDGFVADGLSGGDSRRATDAAGARDVLASEGVLIDKSGRASRLQRFRADDWEDSNGQQPRRHADNQPAGEVLAATPTSPTTISVPLHESDSSVQQGAETAILAKVAEEFGTSLAPRTMTLEHGAPVQLDGVGADDSLFVEIFAHQGPVKGGQQKKVCQDALKLITIGRSYPDAQLVLAFADQDAAAYATKGTWVSEALLIWGVKVVVVELDESLRNDIRRAQLRQVMVNPSAVSAAAE